MSASARKSWLDYLAREMRCSAGFVRELDTQLTPTFRELTGLDLASFRLAPPMPSPFEVRTIGPVATLAGDLVGSRVGSPVVLAWTDREHRRAPRATDDVGPSDVEAWWHSLPVDEIRAAENVPVEPPFDIARYSSAIDFALRVWPHVRLDIELREPTAEERLEAVRDVLNNAQTEWNAGGHARRGLVHSIGRVTATAPHRLTADIDFGSAGPGGLEFALDGLDALGAIAVIRVSSY